MGVSIQLHASVTLLPTEIDPAGFQRRSGNFEKKKKKNPLPLSGIEKGLFGFARLSPAIRQTTL